MLLLPPTIPSKEENFSEPAVFPNLISEVHDGRHLLLQLPDTLLRQEEGCTQEFKTSLGTTLISCD